MANPEHLELLEQGVEAWNRWKYDYSGETDLSGAKLAGKDLTQAIFVGTDLSGADLKNARLEGAYLSAANLSGADLSEAFLAAANLRETRLDGANMKRTAFHSTNIGGIDLSSVANLRAIHLAPSTIGTDTLVATAHGLSKNPAPQGEVEMFLRGAGVEEQFIELFQDMIGQPIEFYSCFISYSHSDKVFARRLYDSLQGRGIRCWLDEHALLPGDRIMRVVNQAIRVNDKLLLCCSEKSLQSAWVVDEIAAAVKKEREEQRDVLIPLNLDGYFFDWTGDHSVRIQERLAADFTGWEKDNAKFERELEKVVKALRPSAEN